MENEGGKAELKRRKAERCIGFWERLCSILFGSVFGEG